MTNLYITKSPKLSGMVKAPPSKAFTHRASIAALLSEGTSEIYDPLICDDIVATLEACTAFGARVKPEQNKLVVKGSPHLETPNDVINCKESGSTLRFITPVASLADGITVLTGGPSLRRRPIGELLEALSKLGVRCYTTRGDGYPPVIVFGGGIRGGETSIVGDVSSQYISGLLFACPRAFEDTEIHIVTPLESKQYVKMTMEVLSAHGIRIDSSPDLQRFRIPARQTYTSTNHKILGDYSSAAFLLAASAITESKVKLTNLSKKTTQADVAIIKILQEMGADINVGTNSVEVNGGNRLNCIKLDASATPDLVPVCAVLACYAEGQTQISHAERLRIKESDRLSAIRVELTKMGAEITETRDGLLIQGPSKLRGCVIDPHNDHRIAMACAVAALGAEGITVIRDSQCINKSYPKFVQDLRNLGAKVYVK
ncbi:3-phosphoshikimate 1-carboxyvinyltransferase [Candidatus Bathyarchaeota archaeon]|nr:3-phosphoshikimate 1-carboxyvinyltransferase [Candidatus Bathyarchaeota archaeon]